MRRNIRPATLLTSLKPYGTRTFATSFPLRDGKLMGDNPQANQPDSINKDVRHSTPNTDHQSSASQDGHLTGDDHPAKQPDYQEKPTRTTGIGGSEEVKGGKEGLGDRGAAYAENGARSLESGADGGSLFLVRFYWSISVGRSAYRIWLAASTLVSHLLVSAHTLIIHLLSCLNTVTYSDVSCAVLFGNRESHPTRQMAELLGTVASVAQLVTLSGQLLAGGYGFLSQVSRAPSEIRSLLIETASINDLLSQLQALADSTPGRPTNDALLALECLGAFQECRTLLTSIQKALDTCAQTHGKDVRNFGRRLIWLFKEKETKDSLQRLHHLRGLLANAVEANSA